LVAAAKVIGPTWPGKSTFKFAGQYPASQYTIETYRGWPEFLAIVFRQRRWINELSLSGNATTRFNAIHTLVTYWPDNKTRQRIARRAKEDTNGNIRSTALQLLAENWLDIETHQLIEKLFPVNGAAASLYGKKHSQFGEVIFQKRPGISGFYLNPLKPLSAGHIQEAAQEAGIPPEKIDETVRSLSEHMGWDITKGSEAGKFPQNQNNA
jgi:hypothetical protein